jgi:hypothetical protein
VVAALQERRATRDQERDKIMHAMHSNLGEQHSHATRVLHEPRRANRAKTAATKLTVAFPGQSLYLELCRGERPLLAGTWDFDVSLDGEPVEPIADYEETCWVADKDVNYLELEMQLSGGMRLERHVVFAREDEFVFLADAVFGPRAGKLEYRGWLPLAEGTDFEANGEHAEGTIVGKKRLATVFPLALPEWRTAECAGRLERRDRTLELGQTAAGQNLFAPMFFDLKSRRFGKPWTWRPLTVAQSLAIQPADSAVGYRVMIGREQWLVYRSLSPRANRTLLGHNLSSEFLLARFSKKGEVQSLIEVE